ncbi:hypothetical protein HPP92_023704 [Vanilla planifolia]|uniref:Pentatricopeptide repeat-containing protein n=1 Tax=Vanilla planifolia TaxID=51239 RepID=A0A835PZ17_VANPL|nr:hypothetical protein HPP92_023704 [Vanilla planifolia]
MDDLRKIHAQLTTTGLINDCFPASRAIAFCALSIAGDIKYAHLLFDQIPDPNTYIWNTMIRGYSKRGSPLQDILLGKGMHGLAYKYGFHMDILVQNGLMYYYVKRGDLTSARSVFDQIVEKDVYSWTIIIDAYSNNGHPEDALKEFRHMLILDVRPNAVTVITVLSACSQISSLNLVRTFHSFVEKSNFDGNLNLMNAFIDVYGYVQANQPEEALDFFLEMIAANVEPMVATFVSVLSACAKCGRLDLGRWIYDHYMKRKRLKLSVNLSNSFIDMYAKCGDINAAEKMFQQMTKRDIVSWNSMIMGYAIHGHGAEAVALFEQLISKGGVPDDITFIGVLSACSHVGLVSEGRKYFFDMKAVFSIQPKPVHYSCMVDLLGRVGLLGDAYAMLRNMPMEPDEAGWGALLNACRMHGNSELGHCAGEKLLGLNPGDSGVYSLMTNVYAISGKWDEVKQVMLGFKNDFLIISDERLIEQVVNEFFDYKLNFSKEGAHWSLGENDIKGDEKVRSPVLA